MSAAVPLATDHTGMRVDYSGLLRAAQSGLRSRDGATAEMLRQLGAHLSEMGSRYYAGDLAAVDEFLQLYCIEREGRNAAVNRSAGAGSMDGGA